MGYRITRFNVVPLVWLLVSSAAVGQTHEGHTEGMQHMGGSMSQPTETGQSAFAALAEIIALLEADPHTDWSRVNIDALRTHLVDMDRLTLSATVDTQELDGQRLQFYITGEGRTLQSIQSMVPVHAGMVRSTTGWDINVTQKTDGVILTVNPGSSEALSKLKALGFFGFMTIGAHHQAHHYQMATGQGH